MNELWWYVARSGGIVSLVLAACSVIWGLLLASGILDRNPPKKWLLGMHRWLAGLTVSFIAVHVAALWLDSFIQYSLTDLFVPFASSKTPGMWAMAWGIIAFYLLAAVQVSSMLMRRIPRRLWRLIHMSSFAVLGTGIVHGATAGTDGSSIPYVLVIIILGLVTVFLTSYRVLTKRPMRNRRAVAA